MASVTQTLSQVPVPRASLQQTESPLKEPPSPLHVQSWMAGMLHVAPVMGAQQGPPASTPQTPPSHPSPAQHSELVEQDWPLPPQDGAWQRPLTQALLPAQHSAEELQAMPLSLQLPHTPLLPLQSQGKLSQHGAALVAPQDPPGELQEPTWQVPAMHSFAASQQPLLVVHDPPAGAQVATHFPLAQLPLQHSSKPSQLSPVPLHPPPLLDELPVELELALLLELDDEPPDELLVEAPPAPELLLAVVGIQVSSPPSPPNVLEGGSLPHAPRLMRAADARAIDL